MTIEFTLTETVNPNYFSNDCVLFVNNVRGEHEGRPVWSDVEFDVTEDQARAIIDLLKLKFNI